jgi:surfeit locus 1 family protein
VPTRPIAACVFMASSMAAHSLLLDNRQRDGKVGVELLQPFQDRATGLWLLVNRGWLPWPDRRVAPQFTTPAEALNIDTWVYVAPGATFQLHADPASNTWPQTITAVEPAALWKTLDRDGFTYEVRAEPGPASYQADWPVVAMGPEKHLGYAVQWFAMAIGPVRSLCLSRLAQRKGETPWERP